MSEIDPVFKLPHAVPSRFAGSRTVSSYEADKVQECCIPRSGILLDKSMTVSMDSAAMLPSADSYRSSGGRRRHASGHYESSGRKKLIRGMNVGFPIVSSDDIAASFADKNSPHERISSKKFAGDIDLSVGETQKKKASTEVVKAPLKIRHRRLTGYIPMPTREPVSTVTLRDVIASNPVSLPDHHNAPADVQPGNNRPEQGNHARGTPRPFPFSSVTSLDYDIPEWSCTPPSGYSFEIIKEGTIIGNAMCGKPFLVIGRLPGCNIRLEHPSVSRYHAVVQYCVGTPTQTAGYYIYDLGSTHGTAMNKEKLKGRTYYPLKDGYVLKFGLSTRLFAFQGLASEKEEEARKSEEAARAVENLCDWGMKADAQENLEENPFALMSTNEELYNNDPKKTLRCWFEREGYELEYNIEENGEKNFICSVRLPIDNPNGQYITVESSACAKKKESVVQCALEACKVLDTYSLLHQAQQESHQPKKKWEDQDYYDSDEDPFLDRTGTLEKKREWRKRLDKGVPVETNESLIEKISELEEKIQEIRGKLDCGKQNPAKMIQEELDPLDSYMLEIADPSKTPLDRLTKSKLRNELADLEKKKQLYEKMKNCVTFPHRRSSSETITSPSQCEVINKKESYSLKNDDGHLTAIVAETSYNHQEELKTKDPEVVTTKMKKQVPINSELEVGGCNKILMKPSAEGVNPSGLASKGSAKADSSTIALDNTQAPAARNEELHVENPGASLSPDEDYSMWLPPVNQSGDGTTHLNVKYGY